MNHDKNGPVFGSGHDLIIADKCNGNKSWANLGETYHCPSKYGSIKANSLLAG